MILYHEKPFGRDARSIKASKSLKNEGFRELKRTCPLCSLRVDNLILKLPDIFIRIGNPIKKQKRGF